MVLGRIGEKRTFYFSGFFGGRARGRGEDSGPGRSVRGEKLEEAIWTDVSAWLAEPRRLEEEYQRRLNLAEENNDTSDRHKLQALPHRVRRQISKWIDA